MKAQLAIRNPEFVQKQAPHMSGLLHGQAQRQQTPQHIKHDRQVQDLHEHRQPATPARAPVDHILQLAIRLAIQQQFAPIHAQHHERGQVGQK